MENIVLTPTPEWMVQDGLTDTVAPWEYGLRTDVDSPAFEWWYFDAHLGDYTLIFAQIIASKKFGYKLQPVLCWLKEVKS